MPLSADQTLIEVEIAELKCEDDTLEVAMFYYLEDMLSSYRGVSGRKWVLGPQVP